MIPKKIHYCWFGGNPLTEEVKCYIDTWKKYCPNYELVEWNEKNFDITENAYCREAYEAKKWAFVADYVRLKVLYEYGGIYMDTDVELCYNLDALLGFEAVSGYETETNISTGTIAACQGNEWIEMLLHDYDNRHFLNSDGSFDMTTNVKVITKLTKEKYGIEMDGERKIFGNNCILLPFDYLCAKSYRTGEINKTENTLAIHHFAGSWLNDDEKRIHNIYKIIYKRLRCYVGDRMGSKIATVTAYFKLYGIGGFCKLMQRKMDHGKC